MKRNLLSSVGNTTVTIKVNSEEHNEIIKNEHFVTVSDNIKLILQQM